MPLFRFLPGEAKDETDEQRDYLFLVIQDIIIVSILCVMMEPHIKAFCHV